MRRRAAVPWNGRAPGPDRAASGSGADILGHLRTQVEAGNPAWAPADA